MSDTQHYKIKLASGRILGPMDLARVRLFMLKGQILGNEQAREYPQGDWKQFHQIAGLAQLLIRKAEGKLEADLQTAADAGEGQVLAGATKVFTISEISEQPIPEIASTALPLSPLPETPVEEEPKVELEKHPSGRGRATTPPAASVQEDDSDKTMVRGAESLHEEGGGDTDDRTIVRGAEPVEQQSESVSLETDDAFREAEIELGSRVLKPVDKNIAQERTIVLQRSSVAENVISKAPPKWRKYYRLVLAAAIAGLVAMEVLFPDKAAPPPTEIKVERVRPKLPAADPAISTDPAKSIEIYGKGMAYYVADTVSGYKRAAQQIHEALKYDINNVKALAMLASCYLNLIDSSNKDENYFTVISDLIKMSRAKSVDLSETVIADVEFYITVNKAEAAQDRIVKYAREHQGYGLEMFYYLGLAFYQRGDFVAASRYLSQIPDQKAFSAKVFYLRGQVAEALNDQDAALQEYNKAIQLNAAHAKSRLRIAEIMNKRGDLKSAGSHLDYLVVHPELLAPKDLASGFYLHSVLQESLRKLDVAIADAEKSVKLDPGNHDYSLQLYILRAAAGGSVKAVQKEARMYYFLGEGEKLFKQGKNQEALTQFLEARNSNDGSPVPLLKIGDMFRTIHDFKNALANYKLAAEKSKDNIEVWSKYIDMLIQNFEWDEALKAMDRFRKLPVPQSSIDKAAADIYAKQGRFAEAITFYRKAMARDTIDPEVYIAYANTLMATKSLDQIKEAPFFFALALRFDPLNFNAIIGSAKAVAATESIDRAINLLQDELLKGTAAKAELLSAIAEFQIQKGDLTAAQENVDQAMRVNPEYATPWKLQAQIYAAREHADKHALDRALEAYKSYSDRNPSDPTGYLERYRIYANQLKYDKAMDEISKIYGIYPKYPNIHYYKGVLYARMGNARLAAEEYKAELTNNPDSVQALLGFGNALVDLKQYNDALAQFNKAMQLSPGSAEPKALSGYANYLLKNYPGAVALFNAAIALDPANPMTYRRMGKAYEAMGDYQNAAASFRKYLQMEPDAQDRAEFERYR